MPTAPDPMPLRVFLAEDSAELRRRIAEMLQSRRIDVVGGAQTPEACIRGILHDAPDAVVLDVQLEGGTGLQVLKAVRAARPEIAFVVFSNSASEPYRKRYLGEGARRFLDKSTDFCDLASAIECACERRLPH